MTRSTFSRRRFIGVLAAASTLGTARAESWTQHTWRGRALGADARLTLSGPPAQVDAALRDAIAALREVEALFSLHDPSSALARLNATGRLDPAPEALLALLHRCTTLHAVTEGRFDPTVQPLWRALYEGGDAARLARAHAAIGWHRVRLSDRAVQLDAGQALTLNGIAQGAAADAVVTALRRHGIDRALVNTGETVGLGGPWRLGIHDPASDALATRQVRDAAIATSSPGALRLGAETHILSPTAGAAPRWSTVSVEAADACTADALSTAAALMDLPDLQRLLDRGAAIRRIVAFDANGDMRTLSRRPS